MGDASPVFGYEECKECDSGRTIFVHGKGGKDFRFPSSFDFADNVDQFTFYQVATVVGDDVVMRIPNNQFDYFFVINFSKEPELQASLQANQVFESHDHQKWAVLLDSGSRLISPDHVVLVDLKRGSAVQDVFSFNKFDGYVDHSHDGDEDGPELGSIYWFPDDWGFLFFESMRKKEYLLIVKTEHGNVNIKRHELPFEINMFPDQIFWFPDESGFFFFDSGRIVTANFKDGKVNLMEQPWGYSGPYRISDINWISNSGGFLYFENKWENGQTKSYMLAAKFKDGGVKVTRRSLPFEVFQFGSDPRSIKVTGWQAGGSEVELKNNGQTYLVPLSAN